MEQRQKRTRVWIAVLVSVFGVILALPVLYPVIHRQIVPLNTSEELEIVLRPERGGRFSIWLPILEGSPLGNPVNLLLFGDSSISIAEDSLGTFLNITATQPTTIFGHSSFQGPLNESYLEYEWSVMMGSGVARNVTLPARAFSTGNVTVILRFNAASDYCGRTDLFAGTLRGDGGWGALAGESGGWCT
ncbi:MAG: hypothetical protein ACE5JE_03155 [Thermoplasmata archaeon]